MRGIYKRGNIYWIAYKAGEKVVRESTGTSDPALASSVLCKRRTEVFERRWIGRPRSVRTPLSEAIPEFMTVYSKPRKVSWREDQRILGRFAAAVGSGVCLQDIDRRAIERFLTTVLAAGASKARANRYIQTLKCFFNRCIDWEKMETNPCRGIRLYPEMPRTHWLGAAQIKVLLEKCSDRVRPIVQVALLTGLRIGDILRLTWDQIHFEESLIRITQSKTQIPLLMPISRTLEKILRGIAQDANCRNVFHWRGKPLRRFGWLRTDFTEAIRAAGLEGTRFHDLRHTAATQLRRLGRDLQVVQQLLGHRSIRMTLRYSHVRPEELQEAVNLLGERMIPLEPGHFTATSQSAAQTPLAINPPLRSEAIIQQNEDGRNCTTEKMQTAVNLHDGSSEDW